MLKNTKSKKINSHPEFSSGSHEMLKQVQHDVSEESGRSMVEMLGVLAVIGVLSIAGIAGYTTAMKRHRANELLNEASKRAVVLAMKIAAGQTLPSTASNNLISEFTDPSDYTFEVLANSDTNKFDMQITGVSEEVCEQMKVMIGNDGMMSISDCTTSPLTLTFNKDLSKGSSTPSGPTVEEDATVDSCPMGSSTSYSGGDYTTKLVGYDRCQCVDATPVWNGTACMPLSTAKVCNSSTPCASGEYCRYKDVSGLSCYSNANGFPVTGSGSSTEVNGTCEKVVGVKKTIGGEFYYSTNYLDWFSAKSWCEAIGKNLVKLSTLEASPYNCSTTDYTCNSDNFSPFRSIGVTDFYWTDTCTNKSSGCDNASCNAWDVTVYDEGFRNVERNYNLYFALCE